MGKFDLFSIHFPYMTLIIWNAARPCQGKSNEPFLLFTANVNCLAQNTRTLKDYKSFSLSRELFSQNQDRQAC